VLLHVPESPRPLVARIRRLDADMLECRLTAPGVKLTAGREVSLKFRLPLYRKDFFELTAKVDSVEDGPGGTALALRFTRVSAADRADIQKFLDDMGDLRRAARGK
jgi:hypothetical protein